jgi:hypothetical protein
MSKLIWIGVKDPDRARQLAETLEMNGVHADVTRSMRGQPEVRIQKPRLRRMKPFMVGVESVVRRWLAKHAPDLRGVTVQTVDERFEIRSPIAHAIGPRTRHATPA